MKKFPYVVSLVLFCIPFLWLKSGEMDLGGDTSRLYFYDAYAYLSNHSLFGISPSNFGYENISFFGLPFVALLVLIQKFISSPTIVISTFHGLSLSLGFLGCYLTVKELLSGYKGLKSDAYEISAIAAGLFYVFSQVNIQGWDKVILTHDQFFLNPICFYLLLRFVLTNKYIYLFSVLIITFVYSHNFGYAAAPPFFAFYPLSLLFILIYAKFVKKTHIPIKGLIVGLVLFLLLQAFHIVPQLYNLFASDSATYTALFSSEAKFDRGLGYFSGIAESVRVNRSIFSLPQLMATQPMQLGFVILPFILLAGFLYNKNRLYLLTGVFFLVYLFLVSANITGFGLAFYKSLFSIPGFAMFRNFYGQWAYAYQFFYALLLGQAFVIVLSAYKKNTKIILFPVVFIAYVVIAALPLIDGTLVNKVLWQSRDVKIAMTKDQDLEGAIQFTKNLKEGRVLTLPLSDTGYQMVAGPNGGVYQGPSLVAYLAGKKDFSGVNEFGAYGGVFQRYIADKNYSGMLNMLALLDVKYIFYNADIRIYDEQFPDFPYSDVRKKMQFPSTQRDYGAFLSVIGAKEIFHKGTYHVYQISDTDYSLYSPNVIVPTSTTMDTWDFYFNSTVKADKKIAIVPEEVIPSTQSALFLKADQIASQDMLYTDFPIPVLYPFVRWQPNSPIYFVLAMREKRSIEKLRVDPKAYIRAQMNQGAKRISELQKWGSTMSANMASNNGNELLQYWTDPKNTQILEWGKYNSWEASLSRYFQSMHAAADGIASLSENSYEAEKLKRQYMHQVTNNQKRIEVIISSLNIPAQKKKQIYSVVDVSFKSLEQKVKLENLPPGYWYYIFGDRAKGNMYSLYLHKSGTFNPEGSEIHVANTTLRPAVEQNKSEVKYEPSIAISTNSLAYLHVPSKPQTLALRWQPAKDIFPIKNGRLQKGENITIDTKKYNAVVNKIFDLNDGKYLVSFEYNTRGKPFETNIFLKAKRKLTDKTEPAYLGIFRESISSRRWQKFSAIIDSFQTQTLLLGLKSLQDGPSEIHIRNLRMLKLDNPPLLSVNEVHGQLPIMNTPKLQVKKINPTRYEVHVIDAPESYMLVLSVAYSKNWKLFTAEGKQVAKDSHFSANGYANGWIVKKSDTPEGSYTLIVELESQKVFYISLVVSTLAAFVVLIGFIFVLFKHGKK